MFLGNSLLRPGRHPRRAGRRHLVQQADAAAAFAALPAAGGVRLRDQCGGHGQHHLSVHGSLCPDPGVQPCPHRPGPAGGAAPQRICRRAGTQNQTAAGGAGSADYGRRLFPLLEGPAALGGSGLFLPGGGAGDDRHLLPVHRRIGGGVKSPALQSRLLLPDPALHRRGGIAAPDEAERRGPCQHLHPLHHGTGNGIHYRQPLPELRGNAEPDVSLRYPGRSVPQRLRRGCGAARVRRGPGQGGGESCRLRPHSIPLWLAQPCRGLVRVQRKHLSMGDRPQGPSAAGDSGGLHPLHRPGDHAGSRPGTGLYRRARSAGHLLHRFPALPHCAAAGDGPADEWQRFRHQ